MEISTYIVYVTAILVLTASPGPSILLCVTKSISQGYSAAIYTALGSLTAIVGIMTLSFTGLGVLIASSELVFTVVKWAGALYLLYLGIKLLFSSARQPIEKEPIETEPDDGLSRQTIYASFTSGFLVGATNPKAIVFFTALFPQFINAQQALMPQYLVMVVTFSVLELGWLLLYAYFGARSAAWFTSRKRVDIFNRVTGSVFIFAAIAVSLTKKTA